MFEPPTLHTSSELLVVRLLRVWLAARDAGEDQAVVLRDRAPAIGSTADVADRAHVVFQAIEQRLGRPLVPECCCSRRMSADEAAIVGLLRHGTPATAPASRQIAELRTGLSLKSSDGTLASCTAP